MYLIQQEPSPVPLHFRGLIKDDTLIQLAGMYPLSMSKIEKQTSNPRIAPGVIFVGIVAALSSIWFKTNTQDPFNLPKFQVLMILTPLALYFAKFRVNVKLEQKQFRILMTFLAIFIIAFINASLTSGNTYLSFIGLYQRNLGFFTYFCFVILFVVTLLNLNINYWKNLVYVYITLAIFEIVYGLVQHFGLDPNNWKNPYSPIIGTFGNPNYQSAFLGVAASVSIGLIFLCGKSLKVILVIQILCSLFLIQASNSSQGFMSFGIGASLILLFQTKIRSPKMFIPGATVIGITAVVGVLGLLNKGPVNALYQSSISARGDYWRAGFSMMNSHPIKGVGIERFGDYFGAYRDLTQVRNRSYATYSDNAHNVFIQFGATGGVPLFVASLLLWLLVIYFGFKKLQKIDGREFQVLLTFIGGFIGFVAISLISPENIGFTVWAWIFAGAICGISLHKPSDSKVTRKATHGVFVKSLVAASVFVTGVMPAIFLTQNLSKADQGMWNSLGVAYGGTGTLEDLLLSIKTNVSFAPNEQRYQALAASVSLGLGQNALAREYSNAILNLNSRSIDAYKIMAVSYEKENRLQDAIDARLKYLELDRYNLENLDKLSRNNLSIGNKEQSLAYLDSMKKIQAENPLVISLQKDLNSQG